MPLPLPEAVPAAAPRLLLLGEGLPLLLAPEAVREGAGEPDCLMLPVPGGEAEGVPAPPVTVGTGEVPTVAVCSAVKLDVAVGEAVPWAVPLAALLPVLLLVPVAVGHQLPVAVALQLLEALRPPLPLAVLLAEKEPLPVGLALGVPAGVSVPEAVPVPPTLPEALRVNEAVGENVAARLPVPLPLLLAPLPLLTGLLLPPPPPAPPVLAVGDWVPAAAPPAPLWEGVPRALGKVEALGEREELEE